MRDKRSTNDVFRAALSDLGMMLVYEASRDLSVDTFPVSTPVDQADGFRLTEPPHYRSDYPRRAWHGGPSIVHDSRRSSGVHRLGSG